MFGSHTVVTDTLNNLYVYNALECQTSSIEPALQLQYPLSSIQNFIYKECHYLIGLRNHTNTDSLILINLATNIIVKEIELEFKLHKFCLGAKLMHDIQFESDEN
jgi:hypothetical protein